MITDNQPPRQAVVSTAAAPGNDGSYVDWPAILAGSAFAIAISFLLISFGAGLGLSLTSPFHGEGVSAAWVAIAAGIWLVWVMVTGFGAGGYVVGRMRRKAGDATAAEVEARDAMHGLIVWATGVLVASVLATLGVGGLLSAGGAVAEKAADAATEAASSDYFANLMLRSAPITADVPPADAPEPAADADAAAPTADQPAAPNAATDAAMIDPAVQQQVAAVIARTVANGEMAERDISYLSGLVAANSGLDPTEARARVDEVNTEIADMRADALAAVEKARVAGVVFGFIAAATLLIGAIAAFFAAAAGGRHRDAGLGFDQTFARR